MASSPDELFALQFGGASVAENLQRAIDRGDLIETVDGALQLRPGEGVSRNWINVDNGPLPDCGFLTYVVFRGAYGGKAVPHGCSACYKVKVAPRTLRELMAAWDIGKRIDCLSKWGVDIGNRYSQDIYAGYYYATGLDGARLLYRLVREATNADPRLGPDVPISIKRGCSEFEAAVGPSDQYSFTPEMAEVEAYLRPKFRAPKLAEADKRVVLRWIETAYQIGDDTYLDFTAGKRLRPKSVSYEP